MTDLPSLIVGITGHRPPKLHSAPGRRDGYDRTNPLRSWVRGRLRQLVSELDAVAAMTPPTRSAAREAEVWRLLSAATWRTSPPACLLAVTGGALGIDQDFAGVCARLGVPYLVAAPFPSQATQWPLPSRTIYEQMLAHAAAVVHVSARDPATQDEARQMSLARNDWMCALSDEMCAVWNGGWNGGTAHCVRTWRRTRRTLHLVDLRAYFES